MAATPAEQDGRRRSSKLQRNDATESGQTEAAMPGQPRHVKATPSTRAKTCDMRRWRCPSRNYNAHVAGYMLTAMCPRIVQVGQNCLIRRQKTFGNVQTASGDFAGCR
jgi:hypothetical protein